jgi:protein SCO1/2
VRPIQTAETSSARNWKALTMKAKPSLAVRSLALILATSALAHHPGADLDEMMGSEEKFFQAIDEQAAPPFELADADGKAVRLSDFSDKIVVLYFIFASCTDLCPIHSEVIADIQRKVNDTPMKDRVQFLAVTTDPVKDTSEVLKAYGPAHGLDARNCMFLTTKPGQPEDTTRKLSEEYNVRFEPLEDGQQMHGAVTTSSIAAGASPPSSTASGLIR